MKYLFHVCYMKMGLSFASQIGGKFGYYRILVCAVISGQALWGRMGIALRPGFMGFVLLLFLWAFCLINVYSASDEY